MSATHLGRPAGRRIRSRLVVLLLALPVAACGGGGGGGGSAPPGLQAGVDINGEWSLQVTSGAFTGSCGPVDPSVGAAVVTHQQATGAFAIGSSFAGTMRGVEVTLQGRTNLGNDVDYSGKLVFAADGTSFDGTVTLRVVGTDCVADAVFHGVRPMTFDVLQAGPIEFDGALLLTFDREIDASTVTGNSVLVSVGGSQLSGTTQLVPPNSIEFRPDELFPVDAELQIAVDDDVVAADGRACTAAIVTRRTEPMSEHFRYRIESPDGQVALDTLANGDATLSVPGNTPGQLWRFNRDGYIGTPEYSLRNDLFGSDRALEGNDGVSNALMLQYSSLPSGMAWFAPQRGDGFRLRTEFLPQSSLVRTTSLPGGSVRSLAGSDPQGEWVLRPMQRIILALPTQGLDLGVPVSASLQQFDPTGLRNEDRFTNLYEFVLTSAATVTFTMRSSVVDSWLIVLSDDTFDDASLQAWRRSILAEDDDGGGADLEALSIRDARLAMPLEPGRYFVAATTFGANAIGAYQLNATAVESTGPVPLVLSPVPGASMPAPKKP